jgi:hypothetical protein
MTQAEGAATSAASGAAATPHHGNRKLPLLMIGALGVVYGDIGTSPIYAFRQALAVGAGTGNPETEVLGLLSLIVWALTLTVAVKYVFFVTRADNRGEGGTLSLMALARKLMGAPKNLQLLDGDALGGRCTRPGAADLRETQGLAAAHRHGAPAGRSALGGSRLPGPPGNALRSADPLRKRGDEAGPDY